MKIRKGKKRVVMRLINIVGSNELTTREIYNRMVEHPSINSMKRNGGDLTIHQLSNILSSYFDKVGFSKKDNNIIWKNRDENYGKKRKQNDNKENKNDVR